MGKNKKSTIVYEGIELDSVEELQFFYWIKEAKENGLITEYNYQPTEYSLSDKITIFKKVQKSKKLIDKEQTLLNPHIYTADFSITFSELFYKLYEQNNWNKIFKFLECNKPTIIDIKGSFNQAGGDRVFSINQKWVYQKHGVYIQKIIPKDLFKITWCPEEAKLTPKKRQTVEKYKNFKSIKEIMKG